jgi:hypothetical protein
MWAQTAKDEESIYKEKSVSELSDLCLIIIIIVVVNIIINNIPLFLLLHFWYLCAIFVRDIIVVTLRGYYAFFFCMMGKKFCSKPLPTT